MKKFLLKTALFLLLLALVDKAAGWAFGYMGTHAKGGYVGHHHYVTDQTHEDILIFGSSRAIHHYNPAILEDSLGLTCYNCGQDGNGIVLFYGLYQMIRERYKPKMVIYDVSSSFDLYQGESNQKYLGWLRGDYERKGIKELFLAIDPTEQYKMLSMMYRCNSKFLQNITDYVHPIFGIDGNGFLPLRGDLNPLKIKEKREDISSRRTDTLKMELLGCLADEMRQDGVRLVFAFSPTWYGTHEEELQSIIKLSKEYNVEFIDYSNRAKYVHHSEYFKDGTHMNARGADEFTKDIAAHLRAN